MQHWSPSENAFTSMVSFKTEMLCETCLVFFFGGDEISVQQQKSQSAPCCQNSKFDSTVFGIKVFEFFCFCFHCEMAVWKAGFVFQLWGNWTHLLTWKVICWALQIVFNFCQHIYLFCFKLEKRAKSKTFTWGGKFIPALLWLHSKYHKENFPTAAIFGYGNISIFSTCNVGKQIRKQIIVMLFDDSCQRSQSDELQKKKWEWNYVSSYNRYRGSTLKLPKKQG